MEKKPFTKRSTGQPVLVLTEKEKALLNCFHAPSMGWESDAERQWWCDTLANSTYEKWAAWWETKRPLLESGELRGFKGTFLQMQDWWDVFIVDIVRAQKAGDFNAVADACYALKQATNEKHQEFARQMKQERMRKAA